MTEYSTNLILLLLNEYILLFLDVSLSISFISFDRMTEYS